MDRLNRISDQVTQRPWLVIGREVREALANGKGVVALESTIITHGMPFPANFETALAVEQVVRDNGAIPATIAIMNGVVHVGLSRSQVEFLSKLDRSQVRKCSRRDLALVMAEKGHGSTTVAATMLAAKWCGIKVFVTGGIGGVHRGVDTSHDISADLVELGRTDVAVVCAGVKSILDIPRTLEVLETNGVTVIVYRSNKFPAFFTPDSGSAAPNTAHSCSEIAGVIYANTAIGLDSGLLIAVPIPETEFREAGLNPEHLELAIQEALAEVSSQDILGKDITPFLLGRVAELTKGMSLKCSTKSSCTIMY